MGDMIFNPTTAYIFDAKSGTYLKIKDIYSVNTELKLSDYGGRTSSVTIDFYGSPELRTQKDFYGKPYEEKPKKEVAEKEFEDILFGGDV